VADFFSNSCIVVWISVTTVNFFFRSTVQLRRSINPHATHLPYSEPNMKRIRFNPRGFRCPYRCGYLCKTPGGLTRHKSACAKNPANIYIDIPHPPSPQARTPSPFHQDHQDILSPPSTPSRHSDVPNPQSPRRIQWTMKAGEKIRTHLYLDGQFSSKSEWYVGLFYLL